MLFATEKLSFKIKDPYPVCIQEIQELEPDLPLSYFAIKKEGTETKDQSTPCADLMGEESLSQGLNGLKSFYLDTFPKIEQESFAQEFIKKGNYKQRLKVLNDTLINCQKRTEELHKIAAEAAGDIYEETDEADKIPEGYELVDKKNDFFAFPDSDVKAYVLRPKKPNGKNLPAIISFAGTRSLKSAAADVNYGASQVNNVKVKFFQWINSLKEDQTKELIITGHSLGGGLAQMLSAMIPHPYEIKTHVVTFNGFGGKDGMKSYNTIYGGKDKDRDYDKFQPTRDAIGYRMEGDVVSLLGERFGETRTVPSKYNSLRIVQNHLMTTIDERIASEPHTLAEAKKEDVSTMVRPISFIVQGASVASSAWNKVSESIGALFEKKCDSSYDPLKNKTNICQTPDGDAELCYRTGLDLKEASNNLTQSMEKFKIGCELCHKDSCVEYAVLNKIVGYASRTLIIAKKACDLGDATSCIEAGTLLAKDVGETEKSDNYYIFMGCAYGDFKLCGRTPNYFFASKYNSLKSTICAEFKSIDQCELAYLSNGDSSIPKELLHTIQAARLNVLINKKHVDLEYTNIHGDTPLQVAIWGRNLEFVKLLIANGAKINSTNHNDETSLHKAVRSGDSETINFLLEKNANVEARDIAGNTALLIAANKSDENLLKLLLIKGANVEVTDTNGQTPLINACYNGNFELVKLLLNLKVNLEAKDQNGNNALSNATSSGNLELVKYLVDHGAKLDSADNVEKTPIYIAAANGDLKIVEYLISKGANLNFKTSFGNQLIAKSLASGNMNMVKFLMGQGATLDTSHDQNNKMIIDSVMSSNLDLVKLVTDKKANISGQDDVGSTPLHYSAFKKDTAIATYLIENGANIEIKNINGNTPIFSAANADNFPMVKLFVEKGANIEARNNAGNTPILKAALQGNVEIVDFLIRNKAKYDVKNKNNQGLLECAVISNNPKLVQYLVNKGIKIDSSILEHANPEITRILNPNIMENSSYEVTKSKQQKK